MIKLYPVFLFYQCDGTIHRLPYNGDQDFNTANPITAFDANAKIFFY